MDIDVDKLLYRRQYILGPRYQMKRKGWKQLRIGENLCATVHPELETIQTEANGIQLTLLGFIIDPFRPLYSNEEVLQNINRNARNFDDVIFQTDCCGGRWLIIYSDGAGVKLFHDTCGLRQVFYTRSNGEVWCGSQPAILVDCLEETFFEFDESAMELIDSPQFDKTERVWPGEGTIYKAIKHLMPNHYLDVITGSTARFWPTEKLEELDVGYAVRLGTEMLQGSLQAAANRYDLMLPVTAGWESRTLLAASRAFSDKITYYISKHCELNANSADIRVPMQLLPRLGLQLNVMECERSMDPQFREILHKNVTMARTLPKSLTIFHHYKYSQGRLNVCGNGSEVAKKCVYTYFDRKRIDGRFLALITGYKNVGFATGQYDKWLQDTRHIAKEYNIDIFDLFYWEQRMGTWGAMYPAEQDIAIEEFWPFSNRKLLTTLMKVDTRYRNPPHYVLYRELIASMWKETLREPINPMSFQEKGRTLLRDTYKRYLLR
ncbi:hypothetical protein ACI7RC_06450 [Brevibacillus sp. B_LB10_24]|uniref:hypothetical protein n=1 Tax=Brevibacillus sp. B_LB10_24 TaxID=3380645 RepID=UPI0038B939A2